MTSQETENNLAANKTELESWIPAIIPTLKARWANHATGLLTGQPAPRMSDWLALLHAAAVNPQRVPHYLSQLLNAPQSDIDLQKGWIILTKLFALTFEALQEKAAQLDAGVWQNLLELQNRILKSAARVSLVRQDQPAPDTLTRQTLCQQIITDLNKKVIGGLNELSDEIVTLIQQNFGYDYVSLFLLNQVQKTLILQSAVWKNQHFPHEGSISLDIGGQEITARAATIGQSILVNDVSEEAGFSPHSSLPKVKAQLSIPLLFGNSVLGVLDVASEQANIFSEGDDQILRVLANHLAFIIENGRLQNLLQRHLHEQTLLYESNVALGTSLDMETVLKLMTRTIAEAVQAGACTICKIDKTSNVVTTLAEYVVRDSDNPPHTWRKLNVALPLSKDHIGQKVLKTGRPVIEWADTKKPTPWQQSSKQIEADTSWGTILVLPFEVKKRITGLIEIYDKSPDRKFSTDDIQLCQILATQTTVAMERAQLFEETRRRLSEVSTLYTMAQDITSTLDLQGILDAIVISLRHVVGCRGCCIFLLDPTEQKLEIKAADGLKPQWKEMAKLNIGEGAAGKAVAQKQTIYIPDTHKESEFIFFDEEVRSLMVIPLVSQGEIIGAINLDDNKPNAFGPAQEQLLTIAAAQAGITIENARLFAKVAAEQQRTQAIIQYMADGLLLIDDQDIIVTCNPALAMMLGMKSGEIVGRKVDSPNLHPNLASITATTTRRANDV